MKKASELGLFITESKGAVFLTRKKLLILEDPEGAVIDLEDFVASSEKMGSFPLLVIEDEAERLAESKYPQWFTDYEEGGRKRAFANGYKAHQKAHPYSESDLRKAMNFAFDFENSKLSQEIIFDRYGIGNSDSMNTYQANEALIQSLSKKELYIETQPVKQSRFISTAMHKYEPKIENGQLKAVWR